jgi:hypothetical protein
VLMLAAEHRCLLGKTLVGEKPPELALH